MSHHGRHRGARASLSPEQSWEPSSSTRQVKGGASEGQCLDSRWVSAQGGGWSVSRLSCLFLAQLSRPDGSNPVPFFLLPLYFGPGGGRQRWRVEFHFFPLFSLPSVVLAPKLQGRVTLSLRFILFMSETGQELRFAELAVGVGKNGGRNWLHLELLERVV